MFDKMLYMDNIRTPQNISNDLDRYEYSFCINVGPSPNLPMLI